MATVIREFFALFGIKTEGDRDLGALEKKMQRFEEQTAEAIDRLKGFGSALSAAVVAGATAAAGGLGLIATQTAETAFEMDSLARSLNMNVEAFQGYAHAMKMAGFEADDLQDLVGTLSERLVDAGIDGPTSDAAMMAARLGVELKDAAGNVKDTETLFLETVDAINQIPAGAERAALAMTFFGDIGMRALPFLEQGSEAIREQARQAKELGVVMDKEGIERALAYRKATGELQNTLRGFGQTLAVELFPRLTRTAEKVTSFVQRSLDLDRVLRLLSIGSKVAGVALGAILGAKVIAGFMGLVKTLQTAVILMRALGAAALTAQGKLLLIPAVIAALFIAVEDFLTFLRGGDSLFGRFAERFKDSEGAVGVLARGLLRLRETINEALDSEQARRLIKTLRDVGGTIVDVMIPAAMQLVGTMIEGFADVVRAVIPSIIKIAQSFKKIFSTLAPIFGRILAAILRLWFKLQATALRVMAKIVAVVARIIASVAPQMERLFEKIADLLEDVAPKVEEVLDMVLPIVEKFIDLVLPKFERVVTWLLDNIPKVWAATKKALTRAKEEFDRVWGVIRPIAIGFIEGWRVAVATTKLLLLKIADGFGRFALIVLELLSPITETLQEAIDAANKLGANIDIDLNSGTNEVRDVIASIAAETEVAEAQVRALKQGGASPGSVSSSTSIGQVTVQVQGAANMTEQQFGAAAGSGVSSAIERQNSRAAQDLQTG